MKDPMVDLMTMRVFDSIFRHRGDPVLGRFSMVIRSTYRPIFARWAKGHPIRECMNRQLVWHDLPSPHKGWSAVGVPSD